MGAINRRIEIGQHAIETGQPAVEIKQVVREERQDRQ